MEEARISLRDSNLHQRLVFSDITVEFLNEGKAIIAWTKVEVHEDVLNYFEDKDCILPVNKNCQSFQDDLKVTVTKMLEYLKYFYGIAEIDEFFNMYEHYEWSQDSIIWKDIPDRRETSWIGFGKTYVLDNNFLSWMPVLIEKNIQPFFAFSYLHKALNEKNSRLMWINATISAELAFKEFLSIIDPRSSSLITYAPSPPLGRLYKEVLQDYTGQISPVFKELSKGAEIRNSLIHKNHQIAPEIKKTMIYIHQVQVAIFHLYTCLYPEDSFFIYLFESSLNKLKIQSELPST